MGRMPEHLHGCDITTYELCTCGLEARPWEPARSDAHVQEIIRERQRVWDQAVRDNRVKRFWRKVWFFSILAIIGAAVPWAAAIVLGLWFAAASFGWLIEGLPGGDARSGWRGWLRFMFW
jgi:hypothetical protein